MFVSFAFLGQKRIISYYNNMPSSSFEFVFL